MPGKGSKIFWRLVVPVFVTVIGGLVVAFIAQEGRFGLGSAFPVAVRPSPASIENQDLPKFRVEVEQLQVAEDGTVTVSLAYINKTQGELLVGLCGYDKTFVVDSAGNNYSYRIGSGIGHVCLPYEAPLTVGPGARASASLVFTNYRKREKVGKTFSLSSEQVVVRRPERSGYPYERESTHNVSLRNLEPR